MLCRIVSFKAARRMCEAQYTEGGGMRTTRMVCTLANGWAMTGATRVHDVREHDKDNNKKLITAMDGARAGGGDSVH
jgi:hypothetical protein